MLELSVAPSQQRVPDVDGVLPADDRGTVLVRSTGERATFYRGEGRDDFTYETAIDIALAP